MKIQKNKKELFFDLPEDLYKFFIKNEDKIWAILREMINQIEKHKMNGKE